MEISHLQEEASQLFTQGDFAAAEQRCLQLLKTRRSPEILHMLGVCQLQADRPQAAITTLREAAAALPADAQILHDLGRACSRRGDWHAAAQAYIRAIDLRPGYADTYLYMGPVYEQVGDIDTAERAYRRALELDPRSAGAAASLASLYEKSNRLEDAGRLIEFALDLDGTNAVAILTRAQLDIRAGRYQAAVDALVPLLQQPLSPQNRGIAANRLGSAYDKLGMYDEAFAAFSAGKEALRTGDLAILETGVYATRAIARIEHNLDRLFESDAAAASQAKQPVFLVGFPRSGTTLLDQILSSHTGLTVLEEKNTLHDYFKDFVGSDADIGRLIASQPTALDTYRNRYWQQLEAYAGERFHNSLIVDKLPLYSIFMPVIYRLFPDARFIFALRDPRDVVLSCFMHAFGLNEAMRHFLSLQGTADYYTAVMSLARNAIPRLGNAAHLLRYEELLEAPQEETQRLCAFLGVEWDAGMLDFQKTARKRRINTPSYHQVIQPIYKSARQRWRNYERHLQPVMSQLVEYVEYFGYS